MKTELSSTKAQLDIKMKSVTKMRNYKMLRKNVIKCC